MIISKSRAVAASALLIAACTEWLAAAPPRPADVLRTELVRHDLSIAGREVVQVRVDFPRGTGAPGHSHPGEEIAHILRGTIEFRIDGRPPEILRAGETRFIPAGTVHAARNAGKGVASVLATYIVEKGKPLVVPAR